MCLPPSEPMHEWEDTSLAGGGNVENDRCEAFTGYSYRGKGDPPSLCSGSLPPTLWALVALLERESGGGSPSSGQRPKASVSQWVSTIDPHGRDGSGSADSTGSVWDWLFRETIGGIPKEL